MFAKTEYIQTSYSAIPLLSVSITEMHTYSQQMAYTKMSTAVLFVIFPKWK